MGLALGGGIPPSWARWGCIDYASMSKGNQV